MSKNAANEELMGQLHQAVCQKLIDSLDGKPIVDDDGVIIGYDVDPRILTAAIAFLNNNKIVMNPFMSEGISELEKKLQDRTTRFKVVPGAAKAAAQRYAESV